MPGAAATSLAHLPPVGYLFAAFLGYNPLKSLLGPHLLGALPAGAAHVLIGHGFFPSLISGPFKHGLVDVMVFATAMCLVAALASWMRGGKFLHEEAHHAHGVSRAAVAAAPRPSGAQELRD